jgi:DNA-binding Xre family transcriptional regulator
MAIKKTKLSQLLIDKGVSSKDLVKGAGLNKTHVSLIKNGQQNITIITLKKICRFLKCTPNDVLEYEKWQS